MLCDGLNIFCDVDYILRVQNIPSRHSRYFRSFNSSLNIIKLYTIYILLSGQYVNYINVLYIICQKYYTLVDYTVYSLMQLLSEIKRTS